MGIRKIRLTGGEPLIRRDILKLVESLAGLDGLDELTMTTNGVKLPSMAQALRDAGVSRINISIDSLKADRFKTLTRTGDLRQVMAGIQAAKNADFKKIKLNAVILAGFNDDEVIDLAQYAVDNAMDISFIEEMPLGEISSHKRVKTKVSSEQVRQQLARKFTLLDSAEMTGGPFALPSGSQYDVKDWFYLAHVE